MNRPRLQSVLRHEKLLSSKICCDIVSPRNVRSCTHEVLPTQLPKQYLKIVDKIVMRIVEWKILTCQP